MWMQLLVGVGGLVLFALLFGAFQALANRARALGGECRMDSIRCLGCLATGKCRSQGAAGPLAERNAARLPSTHTQR
jgi:hypothetical protein